MIYLDFFSGAGGGSLGVQKALNSLGHPAFCKGAFEINKDAIKVYQNHFEGTRMLGDISEFNDWKSLGIVDFIIAESPCTDLSIIKNAGQTGSVRESLEGKESKLFYKFVEAIDVIKPKRFLLENVSSMSNSARDEISRILGVEPVEMNSSLVSAQNRSRLYWFNFDCDLPENKFIQLSDIKIRCPFKFGYSWSKSTRKHKEPIVIPDREPETTTTRSYDERIRRDGKANCLTGSINGSEAMTFFTKKKLIFPPRKVYKRSDLLVNQLQPGQWRPIFPIEAERLQTFPDFWTKGVSMTASYRLMGKAMTPDIIEHIVRRGFDQ